MSIDVSKDISPNATEWVVGKKEYNKANVYQISLSNLINLKRIVIGNNCLGNTRSFELSELNALESVVIGKVSFTIAKNSPLDSERSDGSFRIVNCPNLKSLQFGDQSFSDYRSFELTNLPSLQSIEIGEMCFTFVSLSLTGLVGRLG